MLKGAASKVIVVRRAVPSLVALTAAMLVAIGVAVLATLESAQATFPGENGRIAFSDLGGNSGNDFEIYTMLPDGTAVRQVTNKAGRDQMPSWSPDGTKIGWVRGEGNQEFWVHDVETGRQRKIVSIEDGIDSAVVWSPDGSKLAYTSQTPRNWGPTDIFVMNAHGTNQRRLTSTRSVWEWNVTWSPDGSKLAFTRHHYPTTYENQPDIYVMNADGTNLNNITDSMPVSMSTGYPSWSPDGTKIAFLSTPWSEAAGTPGIYVAKADGNKEPVNITSATTIPELYGPPVWSPDGTKIAFLSCPDEDGEDCDIYIMEADGSTNPVNITNRPQGYYGFGVDAGHTLDWQPLSPPTVPPPSSERCTISGTNGPDNLVGTHGRDVICALGGPDNIRGKDGKDVLYGGTGPDTLIGGPGKDRLVSGPGMDVTIQ